MTSSESIDPARESADDGDPVVLKRLGDDCLHAGGLHPSIRDRLAKVRDVPHPRLATLRGVERVNGVASLVWTFIRGSNVDQLADLDERQVIDVSRGIVSAVELLHARGLVHGTIHGRNLIVSTSGDVWLTDVSPYLYDDPGDDAAAVYDVIADLARRHGAASVVRAVETSRSAGDLHRLGQELAATVVESVEPMVTSKPARWPWVVVGTIAAAAAAFVATKGAQFAPAPQPPPRPAWHPPE